MGELLRHARAADERTRRLERRVAELHGEGEARALSAIRSEQ